MRVLFSNKLSLSLLTRRTLNTSTEQGYIFANKQAVKINRLPFG